MINERIKSFKESYINSTPSISIERAAAFTASHKKTEGEAVIIRRAKAFLEVCRTLPTTIFADELIVGSIGEFRRPGIICPEYSWKWVKDEMDSFENRKQDPYCIAATAKKILRDEIFPYWQGKSLEETFLARINQETAKLLIDTGIIDNDSKWRSAVGEVTADYQDVVFKKGFGGLRTEALDHLKNLEPVTPAALEQIDFYRAASLACEGIITLARRYADKAAELAQTETDADRKAELLQIAATCRRVPEHPPESFYEAMQTVWFTQLGSILSENSLALNLGRFDQYMYPYYAADQAKAAITREKAQELIEALWIKLSEWVWAISSNTAKFFAGYNSFQNLTVGGRTREGRDATNELSYMCLKATENVKTHQPGLSVRIHPDSPPEFLLAVCKLVRAGTGFPAIHNDRVGSEMLLAAGLSPADARDWSNCGCVVPHFRKVGEWTSAVNINFAAAIEYALNDGKSRITGQDMGLRQAGEFSSYEQVKNEFLRQLAYLVKHAVSGSITAQQIHAEIVPRPYLSLLVDGCMEKGKDLSRGGAAYNIGPVLTGIGVADAANSLAVIKKLVFEERKYTLAELRKALAANWEGYERLRQEALACPKYGNDDDYVDSIAVEITDFYHKEVRAYRDYFGSPFNSAFMGISNYIPAGSVIGATPDGRKAKSPLTEGVSPHAGTDLTSPTAAMRSAAKINHDVHAGGTLLNIKFAPELLQSERNLKNLAAIIRAYFALGAFHVQFNVISSEILKKAQERPEDYKDLLVRVAGYSTQFVNLSREAQDAIIARTTYETM
ncbi:glycyl radical protein [Sporomusa acidovorans]|uniref:Choline trimethylamine-lyase n=1 Tax=Sporomusa acidovorans (strain ATCC 49682 / DSM 3132 / Mol) TaxID=1123286 RepID=A0ABZ3IXX4_SPOA4|nr:glycyl radical protein [Sporomusa acidovorans]OZC15851.1 benzylsuccinate synthase alpha subunit [Sporomusa acidovorans DSM 3132]SDF29504.1 formate C-acetyltransferase [Sporomusa acidovorans]